MNAPIPLRRLDVSVGSGDSLDVRHFRVSEAMSSLFEVTLVALSPNPDIDLDAAVGGGASFSASSTGAPRTWTGIASRMRLVTAEDHGLSTYELTIVPKMWLLTQNLDSRMFQHKSEIDIVVDVLGKWGISPSLRLSGTYKKRKYRVQYAESDYDFVCRMLEDAGVSFHFEEDGNPVLSDAPQSSPPRAPIPFRAEPAASSKEYVTAVSVERTLRPGKVTLRDHDYRKPPSYKLLAEAAAATGIESQIERYHYTPGAFVFENDKGDSTPFSDDKGKYRVDENEGARLAQRRLLAQRAGAVGVSFKTNALDVGPGTVVSFSDHPSAAIGGGAPYLVTACQLEGRHDGEWTHSCGAAGAGAPFFPDRKTSRPVVSGVESATVVGPPGEEIHTDEFGRVRVHFHWDRDSKMDDKSSCWIHVNQPWGGAGYGGMNLPRVGQEVIVDFLGGDPDRPVIMGRVFTNLQRVPYKLPEAKTQTVFRSQSTNGKAGYNEIRYEDQAGAELFVVRAEQDYKKLVQRDETTSILNNLTRDVTGDSAYSVGKNRRRSVKEDESVDIGEDQSIQVGGDQSIQVDGDRTLQVRGDHSISVTGDETIRIQQDQDLTIGQDSTVNVSGNRRETIDKSLTVTVTNNRTSDIGQVDSTTAGDKLHFEVKLPEDGDKAEKADNSPASTTEKAPAKQGTTAAPATTAKAGDPATEKERAGPTSVTMTDKKIILTTGDGATITLDGATITLEADVIKLVAKKKIEADAESETVSIHAKKDVALKSDQTMHLSTKDGVLSLHAAGGNLTLKTDKTLQATAGADVTVKGTNITLNASSEALVHGKTRATLSGENAVVKGEDYGWLEGQKTMVLGRKTVSILGTGEEVLIESPLVNINPGGGESGGGGQSGGGAGGGW